MTLDSLAMDNVYLKNRVHQLETALRELRGAIRKSGVKRTPGLYEVIMKLDATILKDI